MFNGIICVCDFCGQVLRGKQGTAEVHKRYIEVKGAYDISIQDWDKTTSTNTFIYVTDKIRKDKMHFCLSATDDCLKGWIEQKEILFKEGKKRHLMEEANQEFSKQPFQKPYPQSDYWNNNQE